MKRCRIPPSCMHYVGTVFHIEQCICTAVHISAYMCVHTQVTSYTLWSKLCEIGSRKVRIKKIDLREKTHPWAAVAVTGTHVVALKSCWTLLGALDIFQGKVLLVTLHLPGVTTLQLSLYGNLAHMYGCTVNTTKTAKIWLKRSLVINKKLTAHTDVHISISFCIFQSTFSLLGFHHNSFQKRDCTLE